MKLNDFFFQIEFKYANYLICIYVNINEVFVLLKNHILFTEKMQNVHVIARLSINITFIVK